jgi:hypothetical protein
METLSAEHRAVLEMYKKERPDIFARLPLPKKLAEEYGVPIKEDTVHLMDFMRSHMSIVNGHYDAVEEKVACKVTDASGVEIVGKPKPSNFFEKIQDDWNDKKIRDEQTKNNMKARSEFYRTQPQESIEERSERWIKEIQSQSENLENKIEMNLLSSQSEPTLHITQGSAHAAFVPK